MVILDCCFAGLAIGPRGQHMADGYEQIGDEIAIEGVATLASVPPNVNSIVLDGESHPAYTLRLLRLLEEGIPGAGELLTVGKIKRHLHAACVRDGLRRPQARTDDQIDQLALVRNRAHVSVETPSVPLVDNQRANLEIIAQATEILTDLHDRNALRKVAHVLHPLVRWSGFYMNDGGLMHVSGVDVDAPPSGRGRWHARHIPGDSEAAASSRRPDPVGGGTSMSELFRGPADTVQDLLDGLLDGPRIFNLKLRDAPFSASGWLARDLSQRIADDTGWTPQSVVVHVVTGRRMVIGLLVVWMDGLALDDLNPEGYCEPVGRLAVVEVVARRAGTAVDNVRMYAQEHRIAETLQQAMLPQPADVTGLDVWTYYAPNADRGQVGGDWYDVLHIAPDIVGLVIGDVVGHDAEAAAIMGQVRAILRAYAFEHVSPETVLERMDQLVAGMRISRPASMVYSTLHRRLVSAGTDPDDAELGEWFARYSRAGHLPPLLLRSGQVVQLDGGAGALIGFGSRERQIAECQLLPGDALVLYTNGLIQSRSRSLRTGLDELVEGAAAITAQDAAGVGEEILGRFANSPEDDVAIVVVRIPSDEDADREVVRSPPWRRWMLPCEPSSIGRARHAVVRTCFAWGITESAAAELVVSELVANGVLHGWGRIWLRLFDTGDGLRIEVEDSNPAPPVWTDGHANRLGGFGMQIVERLAVWGWRPSGSGKLVWAKLRKVSQSSNDENAV
jgi:hypothetical protein